MVKTFEMPANASSEQAEMIAGAFYLSLAYTLAHIAKTEGGASVIAFKRDFIAALKSGDIDMSILDDAKTFDFVIPKIESLVEVKPRGRLSPDAGPLA